MHIVYYICTHVEAHTATPTDDERNVSVPSKTVLHVFDARMIDSRGTHVGGGWGKREKSRKNQRKKVLRDDGVSFLYYIIIFRPEIVLCVCHVLYRTRYRRPRSVYTLCIVIIALRFFQEIKRTRQLSSRYSSITHIPSSCRRNVDNVISLLQE